MKLALTLLGTFALPQLTSAALGPNVTLSTVSSTGYATGDINSVAISRNNLVTYGNFQFATYYGTDRYIYLARRTTSGATPGAWSTLRLDDAVFQIAASGGTGITDDHNTIALGIDGDGYAQISWGMHNVPLNMAVSAAPVTGANWTGPNNRVNFTKLASVTGLNESNATYPEFYNVPNSKDLLLFYRDGGAGGGSGNGNEYINRYNATTKTWSQISSPFLQGISPSSSTGYNGYLNAVTRDSQGVLQATWTWRETPDYQTNHDILYAKSADNGVTWTKQDGTPYGGPITQANAQIVKAIGQGNSLINQAGMTTDKNDYPIVATWYAPKHAQSDDTRQYMLEWFDGSSWQTSQITNRPGTGSAIRNVARPIVMVDDDNRVIVIYRSNDTNNNGVMAAYSLDRVNWSFLSLSDQNMGEYEPTYDSALWESKGILNLFYQPSAISGVTSAPIQVLQWDAKAYFASVPEPTSLTVFTFGGVLLRRRSNKRA